MYSKSRKLQEKQALTTSGSQLQNIQCSLTLKLLGTRSKKFIEHATTNNPYPERRESERKHKHA